MKIKLNKIFSRRERSRQRVLAMVRKELDWFIHDKLSVFILFLLPIAMLYMVGNIQRSYVPEDEFMVYVIDHDNSTISQDFIDILRKDNYTFEVHDNINEPDRVTLQNAEELISTTYLQMYIVIPKNFSKSLTENRTAEMEVYIDGINLFELSQMKYELLAATLEFQIKYQVYNSEILFYPELRPQEGLSTMEMILPNMLPLIMFAVVNMVACQSIIADEPLKRMLISPTRKFEVIIAKSLAYLLLGSVISFSSLLLVVLVFEVQFISFLNAFMVTFSASAFGVTLGIFFSTISRSRLQAAQLFLFAFIMQMMIVNSLRIEPIVDYMPIEIIRSIFTDVAYRGISMFALRQKITLILTLNISFLVLGFIILYFKKTPV